MLSGSMIRMNLGSRRQGLRWDNQGVDVVISMTRSEEATGIPNDRRPGQFVMGTQGVDRETGEYGARVHGPEYFAIQHIRSICL